MGIYHNFRDSVGEYKTVGQRRKFEDIQFQNLKHGPVTLEKVAIALACPLRSLMMDSQLAGKLPHLYALGWLDSKEIKRVKRSLQRDFYVDSPKEFLENSQDLSFNGAWLREKAESFVTQEEQRRLGAMVVAYASIELHGLLAGIDVGYASWEQLEPVIIQRVETITSTCEVNTWLNFADHFHDGERQLRFTDFSECDLSAELYALLKDRDSPWRYLDSKLIRTISIEEIPRQQFFM